MIKSSSILYVELKTGHKNNGPAWIGRARYSKSGRSIYFDGKVFKSAKSETAAGNYYEIRTGNEYWISAAKKNRQDRHWEGSGKISVDRAVLKDYLAKTGLDSLPEMQYQLVDLNNTDIRGKVTELKQPMAEKQ
ncbi:MAG: hypothetical protein WCN95_02780 [bacterium]